MVNLTNFHERYGLVSYISASARIQRSAMDINRATAKAIFLDQVMFAFDKWGNPVGYWTWAFVTEKTSSRLVAADPRQVARINDCEWNEGALLWITDFVAEKYYQEDILRYICSWHSTINQSFYIKIISENPLDCHVRKSRHRSIEAYERWASSGKYLHLPTSSYAGDYSSWLLAKDRPAQAF